MPLSPEKAMAMTRRLTKQLIDDRRDLDLLERYYTGDQPLSFATAKFREAFGGLFKAAAVNWCPLVIAAVSERLRVEGFRTPSATGGDDRMWELWQANFMDAESLIAHTEAFKFGRSYVSVTESETDGEAQIVVESAKDVTHLMSPANRRKRVAALRVFTDDDGSLCATLYTVDEIWRWRRQGSQTSLTPQARWEPRQLPGRDWPEVNRLGVVPFVPLLARPGIDGWGSSELVEIMPLQDMVNKEVADMLVASEFTALPQRYVTGLETEVDPVTNQPIEPFKQLQRLWSVDAADAKFGQFAAADLSNYVKVIESFKQDIATLTRTPPHYFYLSGQFPSGESIKSAEAGLVAKAHERMLTFGEAWEEVMRLAVAVADKNLDVLKKRENETIWRDPEYRTEGEHTDATLKKQALGVSWRQLMEDLGYSPQQIERMKTEREAEQAQAAARQAVMFGTAPGGTAPTTPAQQTANVATANGDQITPPGPSSVTGRNDAKFAPPTSI